MRKVGVLFSVLTAVIVPSMHLSFADEGSSGSRLTPMIEVGGGTEASLTSGGMNVLLRVGFGLRHTPESGEPGDVLGPEQLIWAHVNGDFAISPTGEGGGLPFMDINFIPVHNQLSVISENGNSVMGDLQLLPINVGRDIRLDEAVTVQVAVVGVKFGIVRVQNEHVALFAQMAANALGYKMASHVSGLGTFHGVHLLDLGAEGGVAFTINDNFMIRLVVGASADIALGGNVGGGFSAYSDMRAYAAIRVDIAQFIQLFAQVSMGGAWDSGNSSFNGYPQFMAGITFIF